MREIRMITIDAGPAGVKHPGQTYTVSEKEADDLVRGGYAAYTTAMVKSAETAVAPPAQTATVTAPERRTIKGKK